MKFFQPASMSLSCLLEVSGKKNRRDCKWIHQLFCEWIVALIVKNVNESIINTNPNTIFLKKITERELIVVNNFKNKIIHWL